MFFTIIAAMDENRGIGKNNTIPWRLKPDMEWFKMKTLNNIVIMGRKTWESLPEKFKPLPNRINIVISSTLKDERCNVVESLDAALLFSEKQVIRAYLDLKDDIPKIFVIGGGKLYEEAIKHVGCVSLCLTQIRKNFNCDVFFPDFYYKFAFGPNNAIRKDEESGLEYSFHTLRRVT